MSVNEPDTLPTLVPEQLMTAAPIVALEPAVERKPLTVAFDVVPLPVLSRPPLPGPPFTANTAVVPGPKSAKASEATTASQPKVRPMAFRGRRRRGREAFIGSPRAVDE